MSQIKKSDFVQSLNKGLNVISCFNQDNQEMTITEVANKVDLTRANARRILLTLHHLGYINTLDGKLFSLTPKVLGLGYSYLSSLPFRELALPFMKTLALSVNESCSMSVLEGTDIVYVARVQTKRIMTISLGVGTRLPVYATSMGKILLAGMTLEEATSTLDQITWEAHTPNTLSKSKLRKQLNIIRQRGWAVADQELEIGVRSVACQVKDKLKQTVAAVNVSGHASRVSVDELVENFLPPLKKTVEQIENALHQL